MFALVCDYFFANRARLIRIFSISYVCFLLAQIILVLQKYPNFSVRHLAVLGAALAALLAIGVGAFIMIFGILDAYKRGIGLPRAADMSLRDYVKSEDYHVRGKAALRRTDKERKLF